MGPLQYVVVGYDLDHFRDQLVPELNDLSERKVIRMLDLLVVSRDDTGRVSSRELAEILPDEDSLLAAPDRDEWDTQDALDVVGENIPNGSAVALLLFEHTWANRLEGIVTEAARFLGEDEATFPGVAAQIEHLLATGIVGSVR